MTIKVIFGCVWYGFVLFHMAKCGGAIYMYYHTKFGSSSLKNEEVMAFIVLFGWLGMVWYGMVWFEFARIST